MTKISASLIAASLVSAAALPAHAAPAQVIIIRHGEKPNAGNELSPQGFQRAEALVGFFQNNPAVTRYGTPAAIYATDPKDPEASLREIETVTPLAKALGLTIDHDFRRKQLSELAADILANPAYEGKMVLICWEHKVIPEMVQTFGWNAAPKVWPDDIFDQAWILDLDRSRVSSFQIAPEHLLPGDAAE